MPSLLQSVTPESTGESAELREFASDVAFGLSYEEGKFLSPRYLYDDLGSTLFEAITLLPEYGLTRADERILSASAKEIAAICGPLAAVAELGSGSGKKTTHVLRAALKLHSDLIYHPIDVSAGALAACEREVGSLCQVNPVCADWNAGLGQIANRRIGKLPMLLLFLGSSVGNLDRQVLPDFFGHIRSQLRSGDFLLLGADLEKSIPQMLEAYDDPTGVTAAFNLNILGRINRELGANFNLRLFRHEARWNANLRRIEMHLVSLGDQEVFIAALNATYGFSEGETIWTEGSHKFSDNELHSLGRQAGFVPMNGWTDEDWPLAELLWQAA